MYGEGMGERGEVLGVATPEGMRMGGLRTRTVSVAKREVGETGLEEVEDVDQSRSVLWIK